MQHSEIEEGRARWPMRVGALGVALAVAGSAAFFVHMKLAGGSEDTQSYVPYTVGTMTLRAMVTSSGVAVSQDEAVLSFTTPGQLEEIYVKLGEEVKEGQSLMRIKSDTAENSASTAASALALAELQLQKLEEGATDTELAKADQAVVTAQAALTKAQNDLSDALDPATEARMSAAQQAVAAAEAALAAAEAKLDTLENGASDAELAAAEAKVEQAETTLTQAERAEETAESNEANAQSAFETAGIRYCDIDDSLNEICGDLQASGYGEPLTDEQVDDLWDSLEPGATPTPGGPTPTPTPLYTDLEEAVFELAYANTAYRDAIDLSDSAGENVDMANLNLTAAEAALDELEDGASREDIDAAEQGVTSAEAGLYASKMALQELVDGATDTTVADLQAAVNKAEADLSAAEIARDEANRGATQTELAMQQEQVHQAELNLERASIAVSDTTLKSPFDGIVSSLPVKIGQVVNATIPAVTVLTPGTLIFELNVGETDLPAIRVGQPGQVLFDAIPTKVYPIEVFAVGLSPETEQGVIIYKVRCKINADTNAASGPNPSPGMNGSASIITEQRPDVVAIPSSTVRSRGVEKVVEVVTGDGKTEMRPITTGLSDGDNVQVASGLEVGDVIVTHALAVPTKAAEEQEIPGHFQ